METHGFAQQKWPVWGIAVSPMYRWWPQKQLKTTWDCANHEHGVVWKFRGKPQNNMVNQHFHPFFLWKRANFLGTPQSETPHAAIPPRQEMQDGQNGVRRRSGVARPSWLMIASGAILPITTQYIPIKNWGFSHSIFWGNPSLNPAVPDFPTSWSSFVLFACCHWPFGFEENNWRFPKIRVSPGIIHVFFNCKSSSYWGIPLTRESSSHSGGSGHEAPRATYAGIKVGSLCHFPKFSWEHPGKIWEHHL